MYLYRQRYMSGDKANQIKKLVGGTTEGSVSVRTEVAYWRKANAIHRFFYDYMEEDEDRAEIYVSSECLEELLKRCEEIKSKAKLVDGKITNEKLCEELLPTQEGFFFGSTDYDEHYLDIITDTIEKLEEILATDDRATDDYYYYGSW